MFSSIFKNKNKVDISNLVESTRFTENQIVEMKSRFGKISKSKNALNKEEFRQHIGLLGLDSSLFLSDRIFSMLDINSDGKINFEEFLLYLDILLNGTQDEKNHWTFKMIDLGNKGWFDIEDLKSLIVSIVNLWLFMSGNQMNEGIEKTIASYVTFVFDKMNQTGTGKILYQEFEVAMKKEPNLLEVIDFLNEGWTVNPSQKETQKEEIQSILSKFDKNIAKIDSSLENMRALMNFMEEDSSRDQAEVLENHKSGPEPAKYVKPVKFDHDEDCFGLEGDSAGLTRKFKPKSVAWKIKGDRIENVGSFLQDVKSEFSSTIRVLEELKLEMQGLKYQISKNEDSKDENIENLQHIKEEIVFKRMLTCTSQNIPKSAASVRKRKTAKNDTMVFFGHQNWKLVLNMMIGIQTAIRGFLPSYNISNDGYKLSYFFEIIPKKIQNLNESKDFYCFFDYAPAVFHDIRQKNNIRNDDYLKSIGPERVLSHLIKGNVNTLSELISTGKSGSFFYFTADGKYTIKTIQSKEFKVFRSILKEYHQHLIGNPNSFINKIYGLHQIKLKQASKLTSQTINFVVMENVLSTYKPIHEKYDLKGSLYQRITKTMDPSVARKDLNAMKNGFKLKITAEKTVAFKTQLQKDAEFFARNSIIDYSLLIGVHYTKSRSQEIGTIEFQKLKKASTKLTQGENNLENQKFNRCIESADGNAIYYFGIIDIFTSYKAYAKKIEYAFKKVLFGPTISAVPPKLYASRFVDFISKLIETEAK